MLVILLVLILILGLTLTFSKTFSLTNIKIERTDLRVDSSNIDAYLQKYIGKNLIWLRPEIVKTDIQHHFPSIAQVEVDRTWPHELRVILKSLPIVSRIHLTIQPKKEVTLPPRILDQISQSGAGILQKERSPSEEIWMLNQFGLLEPNDPLFEKKIPLIYWETPIDHAPQFGEPLLDQFLLAQILKIPEILLSEFTLETASISYFSDAKEAHYKTYQYELWISFSDNWQEQLKKLRTVFLTIGTTKHQYIDLRVKNRIIYK